MLLLGLGIVSAQGLTIETTNLGANQVTLNLTSSIAGTGYFTLLSGSSATCGTAAQTKVGQDNTGTAAFRIGSLPVTANTPGSYTVRNLTQSTAYTVCFTPDGTTTPISVGFTTRAAAALSSASWANVGSTGFSAGSISYPSLAFSPDGSPYVAYYDGANSDKMTVMKYSGSSWVTVGSAGFSASTAYYTSLAFSPDGTPYVAYYDVGNSGRATVMKYNGTSWVAVGSAGFSASTASFTSLAFSPDGTPYLAYEDAGSNSKATVMKYNGTSWVAVGSAGLSAGSALYTSLSFSPDGTPYVSYYDGTNSGKATVMMYNGTSWVAVGSAGFSAGTAAYTSLTFSPDGTPYVAYEDGGNSSKMTVMEYNGSSWQTVGSAGFSAGLAVFTSLRFSPDGTPYVAYEDGGTGSKATVMKYNGASWEAAGSAGFSAGGVYFTSLAFSPDGTPYVAYEDIGNSNKATVMSLQSSGPSATTDTATSITPSSATLNGTVNDNGSATTVSFDYGTTTSYGTNVASTTPAGGSITSGTGSTATSVDLLGLSPNTTYHFRVNATANSTTVNGNDATFTTEKTTPSVTSWPTASAITFGQTLASSSLLGGAASVTGAFAWTDSTQRPSSVGTFTNIYQVTFTPSDTSTYATVSNTVSVTVAQATPTITTWPTASSLIAGQTLLSSTLSGGAASVAGTFAWVTPSTVVSTGTNGYAVTFMPTDATDYMTVTGNVTVTAITVTIATANLGANQVTLNLTSSIAGTGYFTLLSGSSATCGTAAQTAAGEDSTGTLARHGSLVLTASTAASYTIRNLTGSTAYTACFTPDGTTATVSANITTSAATVYPVPSWTTVGSAGFSGSTAKYTSLTFSPAGTPYVAFEDFNNGTKATVMQYNGTSWEAVGSAGFSGGRAMYTSLAFSPDGTPYVAFADANSNNSGATVMRYNGSSWETVGNAGFTPANAGYTSLAFAPDGTPYVAFTDGNADKAMVMRYNGSSWETVGSADFSAGAALSLILAFSPGGTPYVAYMDYGNGTKATVMQYNGSSWEAVGSAGFSAAIAYYPVMAFSPDGTPYVAYADSSINNQVTVMQYKGTGWQKVGTAGSSPAGVGTISLAISADGTPYAAYEDTTNSGGKATLIRYNGTSWQTVGQADFSVGDASFPSLAFSPDGTPYLAYMDGGNGAKATVMRLANIPSATTDAATNLTSSSATLNGTVNDNGSATTVTFDYGTTTSYGTNVAATTGGTITAGTGSTAVSVDVSSLTPNTTYHFRVNATANGTTVNGSDTTFTTSKTTPTITAWPAAAAITYGQTLASSTLSGGTASVAGTFAWTDATTTPSSAGTSSYSVTFTPTDTNTYTTASNDVSIMVNKATPTLAWSNPAYITYGTVLGTAQLNAAATGVGGSTLAGSPIYSPASGTTLSAGSAQTLSVTFTPSDTTDYTTATKSVQINVNAASQTISFTQPTPTVTYGVSPITLSATANSGLTPTFSVVSGPGTVSGSTLTVTGAGTIVVAANQAGTSNYNAASQVTHSIVVNKATPTLAWSNPADITYGTALSAAQLNATATGIGTGTLAGSSVYSPASGATLNVGSAQTLSVTFTPNDTTDYTTATKSVLINVNTAPQTITFTQPTSPVTYGSAITLALAATGGTSGNPVILSVASGPGSLSGNTLTITGAGTIVVNANQTGNSNYSAATQVQKSVTVSKASSTLTGPATQPVFVIYGQSGTVPVSIAGQYSGSGITAPSGSINYTVTNSSGGTVASGPLTIASGSVSVPVANTYAPGNYTVTTSYGGDGNYNVTTITSQLQVGQIQPTITWNPPSSITYGTTLASVLMAQAYNGTSTLAGAYRYFINGSTVTSATVLPAGSYTLTASFTPTDTTTYKTATTTAPLVVNKAAVATVGLASSVNPLLVQNVTVLTATVTSSISTPTGTVTFLDGTTPLNSAPLINGVATLNVNTLIVGTHSITVTYSGNSNFLAGTSTAVSQLVQDLTLNVAETGGVSQTILPGGTATYNFTLTPVGGATFPALVSLSVTGLPTGGTYTITPQTLAPGSGVTPVALSITVPQQTASLGGQKPFGPPLAPIMLGILLLPFSKRLRCRANKLTRLTAMLLLLVGGAAGIATLTGCGASNGFLSQSEKNYTVTITATSGSLSHSVTTTLTVQ